MKAFVLNDLSRPPALGELPDPVPGEGEVLLEVAACGLNFGDLLMMEGRYQEMPTRPHALGMEMSGRVIARGAGVSAPAIGARVAVYRGFGGLAERCAVPAAACVPVPDGVEDAIAAAVPVAYGTAHLALFHRARLARGETLIVTGAAGGVGLTAVELARRAGARVIACARGPAKADVLRAAGAAEIVDPEAGDLKATLKALGQADVLYDTVGGPGFNAALSALRPGGRAIVVGFASGEVPTVKLNHLLVKNIDLIGYWWGDYARFDPGTLASSLRECMEGVGAGTLCPHVGLRLPLERAAEGYAALRERRVTGKVVVEIAAPALG